MHCYRAGSVIKRCALGRPSVNVAVNPPLLPFSQPVPAAAVPTEAGLSFVNIVVIHCCLMLLHLDRIVLTALALIYWEQNSAVIVGNHCYHSLRTLCR
jgi:hypothetical protein